MPQVAPVDSPRRPWWRWLVPRFSLRTILLLMTVLCLILGSGIVRAERQRLACAELTRNGWEWSFEQSEDDFNPYIRDVLNQQEPWWLRSFPEDWRRSHGVHYWRTVDKVYDGKSNAPEMFVAIAQLPDIRKLVITHGEHPSDRAIWPIVGRMRTLRELVLRQTTIDDAGMAHLGQLTKLTHLDLRETIVGDEGVKHLAQLTSLEELLLDDTNVTDESIQYLTALPRLKWVDLSNTRVTAPAMAAFLRRPSPIKAVTTSTLRRIRDLPSKPFARSEVERLLWKFSTLAPARDPQGYFEEYSVDADTPLTPEQIEGLTQLRFVEKLVLRGRAIGDADLPHLQRSRAIHQICFDQTSLGHEGFKWLGRRSTLHELAVIGSPVQAQDITELGNFQNLRALALRDIPIDRETLRAILAIAALRDLELTNCPLAADAAEEFRRSTNALSRLSLDSRTISPEMFRRHWPAFSFQQLIWDSVEVDEGVLQWLKGQAPQPDSVLWKEAQPNVRCRWQGERLIRYCSLIPEYIEFDTLKLRSPFIEEAHILKVLAAWRDCRSVDFSGANVGPRAMDMLAGYPYLQLLAIKKTNVSDHDLRHAENWTQLAELDLSGCSVTDTGIVQLEPCWRMEHLWLDGIDISDESMKTIAKMKRLKVLSLRGTKVTDAGLLQLNALTELEVLRLGGTQVTPAAIANFDRCHSDCTVDLVGPAVYDAPQFRDSY